jgi:hypothetical protein
MGACATSTEPPRYAYCKTEPPLIIAWNYVRQPDRLVATGVARNDLPRKFQFIDVHATLTGIDGEGRTVSRVTVRVPDFLGPETRFTIALPLTGSEKTFELGFRYTMEDLEHNGRGRSGSGDAVTVRWRKT